MIKVELTSYSIGENATAEDFNNWVEFVNKHLESRAGFPVEISADKFGSTGDDRITGGEIEQQETLRQLLSIDLWNDWCSSQYEP